MAFLFRKSNSIGAMPQKSTEKTLSVSLNPDPVDSTNTTSPNTSQSSDSNPSDCSTASKSSTSNDKYQLLKKSKVPRIKKAGSSKSFFRRSSSTSLEKGAIMASMKERRNATPPSKPFIPKTKSFTSSSSTKNNSMPQNPFTKTFKQAFGSSPPTSSDNVQNALKNSARKDISKTKFVSEKSRRRLTRQANRKATSPSHVLGIKSHKHLYDIICYSDHHFLRYLLSGDCIFDDDAAISHDLLIIFQKAGAIQVLIQIILDIELNTVATGETIFRVNSLGTKILKGFHIWIGKPYISNLLSLIIQKIVSDDPQRLEVDPLRIEDEDILRQNWINLLEYTKLILDQILETRSLVPKLLKAVYASIMENVSNRWPEMKNSVIAGFFFLRYLCPSLLTPEVYGLRVDPVPAESLRPLKQICKILQVIANGRNFQPSSYMAPANAFCLKYDAPIQNFIQEISTVSTGKTPTKVSQSSSTQIEISSYLLPCISPSHVTTAFLSFEKSLADDFDHIGPLFNRCKEHYDRYKKSLLVDSERELLTLLEDDEQDMDSATTTAYASPITEEDIDLLSLDEDFKNTQTGKKWLPPSLSASSSLSSNDPLEPLEPLDPLPPLSPKVSSAPSVPSKLKHSQSIQAIGIKSNPTSPLARGILPLQVSPIRKTNLSRNSSVANISRNRNEFSSLDDS